MDFAAYFFWMGMGLLLVVAIVLRRVEAERMAVRMARGRRAEKPEKAASLPGRAGEPAPGPVYVVERGETEVSVWLANGREGARPQHVVSVDPQSARCGDCVQCMNDALRWIEAQRTA